MIDGMADKESGEGRREFLRTAGRCLVLGLAGAGTAVLLTKRRIDPTSRSCTGAGACGPCPSRGRCPKVPRKDAHGGA